MVASTASEEIDGSQTSICSGPAVQREVGRVKVVWIIL